MKKILTFLPLGIGISSAIIYIFNIISFRAINNTVAMVQILTSLRMYLWISIISFIIYGIIKAIFYVNRKKNYVLYEKELIEKPAIKKEEVTYENQVTTSEKPVINEKIDFNKEDNSVTQATLAYEPFEDINNDYVINENVAEEKISVFKKYCGHCGKEVSNDDIYCRYCGSDLRVKNSKKIFIKRIINVIEIVIMILIIYFILNMIFDYKSKIEPNFKSPFKISVLK